MSSRVFQSVIVQLKEATDRCVGVADEQGFVIACSELSMVGSHLDDLQAALQHHVHQEESRQRGPQRPQHHPEQQPQLQAGVVSLHAPHSFPRYPITFPSKSRYSRV